ncbi:type I 3-dehydroquinate dehydratase [Amnibacterium soli]|uniref:3-dehydroquinate dehydratase n=1 Tax=Amnibacterium soli TaxID=1282736 RepID=A0ABP8Z8V7_9MICO
MTARIGDVVLGPGRPRICVPLTGATTDALVAEAAAVPPDVADLVELRIDRFADVDDVVSVREAVAAVRAALDDRLPLLFTLRTAAEGGGAQPSPEALRALLVDAAGLDGVAAVDVEAALPADLVGAVVAAAHTVGKPVVTSFHDLVGTPARQAIVERLVAQQALGADVVKLACTPTGPEDVLTLLAATRDYAARPDARPAITMAMGPLGVVSRLAGEAFGSAVTFGAVGAASAPGQVDAARLRDALELIHAAR